MVIVVSRLDIQVHRAAAVPVEGEPEVVLLIDGKNLGEVWDGRGRSPGNMLGPD